MMTDAHTEPTGNDIVDQVVASLQELDDAPVTEHLPIFEAAHEHLRAALSAPPQRP